MRDYGIVELILVAIIFYLWFFMIQVNKKTAERYVDAYIEIKDTRLNSLECEANRKQCDLYNSEFYILKCDVNIRASRCTELYQRTLDRINRR